MTKTKFHDFPGLENATSKIHDFPWLSRMRGNPASTGVLLPISGKYFHFKTRVRTIGDVYKKAKLEYALNNWWRMGWSVDESLIGKGNYLTHKKTMREGNKKWNNTRDED